MSTPPWRGKQILYHQNLSGKIISEIFGFQRPNFIKLFSYFYQNQVDNINGDGGDCLASGAYSPPKKFLNVTQKSWRSLDMTPPIDGGNEVYERDPRSINCSCQGCDKRRKDIIIVGYNYSHNEGYHPSRRRRRCDSTTSPPKFTSILFFWHFLSLFLCLSILAQGVYAADMGRKEEQRVTLPFDDNLESSQAPDIDDPGGGGVPTVIRDNPLLRHRRVSYQLQKNNVSGCKLILGSFLTNVKRESFSCKSGCGWSEACQRLAHF